MNILHNVSLTNFVILKKLNLWHCFIWRYVIRILWMEIQLKSHLNIDWSVLRLVWRNFLPPLDSIPCQLIHFPKSFTSHIFSQLKMKNQMQGCNAWEVARGCIKKGLLSSPISSSSGRRCAGVHMWAKLLPPELVGYIDSKTKNL